MPKLIATLMSLSISSSPPEHVHAVPHITSNSPAAKAPTFPPNPPSALLHPAITIHPHPLLLHSEHRTSAHGTFSYPSTIPQRHKSFPSQRTPPMQNTPTQKATHKKASPPQPPDPLSKTTHISHVCPAVRPPPFPTASPAPEKSPLTGRFILRAHTPRPKHHG